ncbi:hypothetical protein DNTS_033373 [Danionella cerebrum]|uniref:Uncharacterized protein n=1 Tax=Danionella cerebrum TaxID=2873325 RepID=A0A553QKF9_9TELE|nr:hypothetical protein DNTS_033373 [Danionella translucida]
MRRWTLQWEVPELWVHVLLVFSRVCLSVCNIEKPDANDCFGHERHTRNYDYMEGGDVRIRRLYSRTQWFLTIDDTGTISGTQDPNNCYSVLEIRTVSEGGVLAIKGLKSQFYISMNRSGTLQGKNYYTAYCSAKWTKNGKEMFISLSQKGRPLKGKKTRKESVAAHFIPRKCSEDVKKLT